MGMKIVNVVLLIVRENMFSREVQLNMTSGYYQYITDPAWMSGLSECLVAFSCRNSLCTAVV